MLARMRKSMDDKDQGFTLIELLVVMIIIGILAAIAIPVFLNQRKKAADTSAKSDVSIVGKELASYYVDATSSSLPFLTLVAGPPASVSIGTATTLSDIASVKLSDGTTLVSPTSGSAVATVATSGTCLATVANANKWYVGLKNTNGSGAIYYYSASSGLTTAVPTTC